MRKAINAVANVLFAIGVLSIVISFIGLMFVAGASDADIITTEEVTHGLIKWMVLFVGSIVVAGISKEVIDA